MLLLAIVGWVVTFLRADPTNFQLALVATEVAGVQILPTGKPRLIGSIAAIILLCVDALTGVFSHEGSDSPLLLFAMAGFVAIGVGDFVKVWIEHKA